MSRHEPICDPADEFFARDVDRLRALKHQAADENAQALAAPEVEELAGLTDRWTRYCAYRGRVDDWKREERKAEAAPVRESDPDRSIGAAMAHMRNGRNGRPLESASKQELVGTPLPGGGGTHYHRPRDVFHGSASRSEEPRGHDRIAKVLEERGG